MRKPVSRGGAPPDHAGRGGDEPGDRGRGSSTRSADTWARSEGWRRKGRLGRRSWSPWWPIPTRWVRPRRDAPCKSRLLILGANSVVIKRGVHRQAQPGTWLGGLLARKPPLLVRVALANTMARAVRVVRALMAKGGVCRAPAVAA